MQLGGRFVLTTTPEPDLCAHTCLYRSTLLEFLISRTSKRSLAPSRCALIARLACTRPFPRFVSSSREARARVDGHYL
jgi:hypothetical protein